MRQLPLPRETDPDHVRQLKQDALKAAAWDARRLAERCVPELRAIGQDELADKIERYARHAQAQAEEFDSP